jgi:hypothetical protein
MRSNSVVYLRKLTGLQQFLHKKVAKPNEREKEDL